MHRLWPHRTSCRAAPPAHIQRRGHAGMRGPAGAGRARTRAYRLLAHEAAVLLRRTVLLLRLGVRHVGVGRRRRHAALAALAGRDPGAPRGRFLGGIGRGRRRRVGVCLVHAHVRRARLSRRLVRRRDMDAARELGRLRERQPDCAARTQACLDACPCRAGSTRISAGRPGRRGPRGGRRPAARTLGGALALVGLAPRGRARGERVLAAHAAAPAGRLGRRGLGQRGAARARQRRLQLLVILLAALGRAAAAAGAGAAVRPQRQRRVVGLCQRIGVPGGTAPGALSPFGKCRSPASAHQQQTNARCPDAPQRLLWPTPLRVRSARARRTSSGTPRNSCMRANLPGLGQGRTAPPCARPRPRSGRRPHRRGCRPRRASRGRPRPPPRPRPPARQCPTRPASCAGSSCAAARPARAAAPRQPRGPPATLAPGTLPASASQSRMPGSVSRCSWQAHAMFYKP